MHGDTIATSAELAKNAVLRHLYQVHTDPCTTGNCEADLPPAMQTPVADKSPARKADERLVLYIMSFEDLLDNAHAVAMGFTGGEAGVIRIEGIDYFDPDIVTFFGSDPSGARTQVIQHVSRLKVTLRAMPKAGEPHRIGFRLKRELAGAAPAAP